MTPADALAVLTQHLQPDERLHWYGTPRGPRPRRRPQPNPVVILIAIGLALPFLLLGAPAAGIVLAIAAFIFFSVLVWSGDERHPMPLYAITNKRAIRYLDRKRPTLAFVRFEPDTRVLLSGNDIEFAKPGHNQTNRFAPLRRNDRGQDIFTHPLVGPQKQLIFNGLADPARLLPIVRTAREDAA